MGIVDFAEIRPSCTEVTLAVSYEIRNKLFAWFDRRLRFVDTLVTAELRSIRALENGTTGFRMWDALERRTAGAQIGTLSRWNKGEQNFAGRDSHPLESAALSRRTPVAACRDLRKRTFTNIADRSEPDGCAMQRPIRYMAERVQRRGTHSAAGTSAAYATLTDAVGRVGPIGGNLSIDRQGAWRRYRDPSVPFLGPTVGAECVDFCGTFALLTTAVG